MKQLSKDPFEVAFEDENYDEDVEEEEEPPQNPQQQPEEEEEEEKSSQPPPPPPSSSSQPPPPQPQPQPHESPINRPNEEDDDEDEIMVDTQTNPSTDKAVGDDEDDELRGNIGSETLNNNTQINNNNNNIKKKKKQNQSGEKSKEDEEEEEEENMDVELGKLSASGDPDKMAKMQAILSQFTEEQMSRYESFRRSGFQKANMKKLLASITGSPKISIPMTIVVSGIAKMFVGELVEAGRMIMTERGETGPIRPCHIREAYRRLKLEGKVPKKSVPRLFR